MLVKCEKIMLKIIPILMPIGKNCRNIHQIQDEKFYNFINLQVGYLCS